MSERTAAHGARPWWAVIVGLLVVAAGAAPLRAQETPSNMQIVGTISGNDSVSPAEGDKVRVVNGGNVAATGRVQDSSGAFFVEMSKSQSFNGTELTLRLNKSSGTYQLEFGPDNQFTYSGGFPFPQRQTLNPTIGAKVGGGSGGDGGDGGGSAPGDGDGFTGDGATEYDVDGNGVFNQDDIDRIKNAIQNGRNASAADVNSDGIVNTRDAIDAIRGLVDRRRNRAQRGDAGAPDNGSGSPDNGDGQDGGSEDGGGDSGALAGSQ